MLQKIKLKYSQLIQFMKKKTVLNMFTNVNLSTGFWQSNNHVVVFFKESLFAFPCVVCIFFQYLYNGVNVLISDVCYFLTRWYLFNRFFVKAGTPSFIVLVKDSSFFKQFLSGKTIRDL